MASQRALNVQLITGWEKKNSKKMLVPLVNVHVHTLYSIAQCASKFGQPSISILFCTVLFLTFYLTVIHFFILYIKQCTFLVCTIVDFASAMMTHRCLQWLYSTCGYCVCRVNDFADARKEVKKSRDTVPLSILIVRPAV